MSRFTQTLPLSLLVALLLLLTTLQVYYIYRLTYTPYSFHSPSSSSSSSSSGSSSDEDKSIYSFYEHINRIIGLSDIPAGSGDEEGKVMMEEMYRRLKEEFEERRREGEGEGMMLEDWEVERGGEGEEMVEAGMKEDKEEGVEMVEGKMEGGDGGEMMIEKWEEKMGDGDYINELKQSKEVPNVSQPDDKVAGDGEGEPGKPEMMVGKWAGEKSGDADYVKNWKKKPVVDGSLTAATAESKKEKIMEILNQNGTAKDIMRAFKGDMGAF